MIPTRDSTQSASPRLRYPLHDSCLPDSTFDSGAYRVRFARSPQDLDAVLRLRFEVFNLEMGEGLDQSYQTRRDEDEFDTGCHHLMVIHQATHAVIGTYRMQTQAMAENAYGFYSSTEYDLSTVSEAWLRSAVELGRACIAQEHRNGRVLFLLWRGLAEYLRHNRMRFLFGCCSLTSQDPVEGLRMEEHLRRIGVMHPSLRVRPQPGFECVSPANADTRAEDVKIPKLMRLYLGYGATICSAPAIDRLFKTIDFLAWFDVEAMDAKTRAMFMTE